MSNRRWGKAKNRDIGSIIAKKLVSEHRSCIFDEDRIKLREESVKRYLESFLSNDIDRSHDNGMPKTRNRVVCCGCSQSLYCSYCCRMLLEEEELPKSVREKSIQLPFEVLVLLTDLRNKATGVHSAALCSNEQVKVLEPGVDDCWYSGDSIHDFIDDTVDTTFLLFPAEDSIPLVDVASKIKKIIVLDCKWTRTANSGKLLPEISKFQKVHLSAPPKESYYWRWHNEGEGMLSTIEAIFYSSWEVWEFRKKDQDHDLIHLLYIFGIQRALSGLKAARAGKPYPFSREGKEERRSQRRCIGTDKHKRDLERGISLREQAKLKNG